MQACNPRILIVGLGAVGTVVADALNQGGYHPWALSRRAEEDGVRRLHELDGTFRTLEPAARMTSPDAGQPPFDLVILTVRGSGDGDLAAALAPFIDERTIVLPLMNGEDYQARLKTLLKAEHVLTGRIYTATERLEHDRFLMHQRGFIELAGTPEELADPVVQFLSKTLLAGELPVRHLESHQEVVWRKLAYNTPFSILEYLNPGQDFNRILAHSKNTELVIRIQAELRAIAAKHGIDLEEELFEQHLRYARATPYYIDSIQSAPHQETEEIEVLVEYPSRMARDAGMDTPALDEARAAFITRCDGAASSSGERPETLLSEVPPIPGTLPELIDQALERHSDQMIRDLEGAMSYGELGVLVREIAGLVEPGRVVGLLAETGRSFMAAMLGTLYGGATVMPLDPGHPAERIQRLLEQGEVDLLLHDHEAERVQALMKRIRSPRRVARIRDTDRSPGTGRRGGSQVLATSGSTGAPKLIHQDEDFLLHGAFRHIAVVGVDSNDRIAAMNSPEVSGTSRDILMSLLSGAGISWRRRVDACRVKRPARHRSRTAGAPHLWHQRGTLWQKLLQKLN